MSNFISFMVGVASSLVVLYMHIQKDLRSKSRREERVKWGENINQFNEAGFDCESKKQLKLVAFCRVCDTYFRGECDMSRDYAALMIDLKRSRSYTKEDRNFIQYYIMGVIELLNALYCREIVREVDFSAGDEIQGLFASAEAAYLYYRMFSIWLHPVEIRAGIGVGGWDVQIDRKGTTGQDGPAYHNARSAIENADDSEGYPVLFFSGSRSDITINTIIGGAASMMAKQSAYQNQIMLIIELLFPICNDYVHAHNDITPRDIGLFCMRNQDLTMKCAKS